MNQDVYKRQGMHHPLFLGTVRECDRAHARSDTSMRAVGTPRKLNDAVKNGLERNCCSLLYPEADTKNVRTAHLVTLASATPRSYTNKHNTKSMVKFVF